MPCDSSQFVIPQNIQNIQNKGEARDKAKAVQTITVGNGVIRG